MSRPLLTLPTVSYIDIVYLTQYDILTSFRYLNQHHRRRYHDLGTIGQ